MVRVRRLETIVHAFRSVVDVVPNASLYFVGGENQADIDFLRDEAQKLGLADRIVFTGPLSREQAFAYVRAADVCLSPIPPSPIFDVASPTKLVEYMALAKPVVANEHPEQAQVVAASGGGLIVPWAAERFASAVSRAAARSASAPRRWGARVGIMSSAIGATQSSQSMSKALIVRDSACERFRARICVLLPFASVQRQAVRIDVERVLEKDHGVVDQVLDEAAFEPPQVTFPLQRKAVILEKISQRAAIEIAHVADRAHHVPARTFQFRCQPAVVGYAEKQHSTGFQDSFQFLEIGCGIVEVLEHLLRDCRVERLGGKGPIQ